MINAAKKIKSQIVVIDEKGQKLSFVVKPGTSITTKDGSVFTLSGIKKDNKVTVKYVTGKMGIHRAQSIELAG